MDDFKQTECSAPKIEESITIKDNTQNDEIIVKVVERFGEYCKSLSFDQLMFFTLLHLHSIDTFIEIWIYIFNGCEENFKLIEDFRIPIGDTIICLLPKTFDLLALYLEKMPSSLEVVMKNLDRLLHFTYRKPLDTMQIMELLNESIATLSKEDFESLINLDILEVIYFQLLELGRPEIILRVFDIFLNNFQNEDINEFYNFTHLFEIFSYPALDSQETAKSYLVMLKKVLKNEYLDYIFWANEITFLKEHMSIFQSYEEYFTEYFHMDIVHIFAMFMSKGISAIIIPESNENYDDNEKEQLIKEYHELVNIEFLLSKIYEGSFKEKKIYFYYLVSYMRLFIFHNYYLEIYGDIMNLFSNMMEMDYSEFSIFIIIIIPIIIKWDQSYSEYINDDLCNLNEIIEVNDMNEEILERYKNNTFKFDVDVDMDLINSNISILNEFCLLKIGGEGSR